MRARRSAPIAAVPLLALLLLAAVVAGGCSGSRPKPTGAGSTAVLRLMRDWRGVWTGSVKDSPMGGMSYTLYVEESPAGLAVTSAPMREADLEGVRHSMTLVHFDKGTPVIEYHLTQRARTVKGSLVYREDLSAEEDAVFCPEEPGCDKVKLTVTRLDARSMQFRTLVDEAAHADFSLTFARREIPKDNGEGDAADGPDGADPGKKAEPTRAVDEQGHPIDEDVMLKEHPDQDIGLVDKPAPAPEPEAEKKPAVEPEKSPEGPEEKPAPAKATKKKAKKKKKR